MASSPATLGSIDAYFLVWLEIKFNVHTFVVLMLNWVARDYTLRLQAVPIVLLATIY